MKRATKRALDPFEGSALFSRRKQASLLATRFLIYGWMR
jgi:hypothetical protein